MTLAPRVTGEFRVDLHRPPPIDYPVPLAVEMSADGSDDGGKVLTQEVVERLQRDLNFTADVTLVSPGSIAGEGKTRRVIRSYRGEAG
jgi:phenylacetate-coenzyme A ligase PaaK-like adenylate-forming protein